MEHVVEAPSTVTVEASAEGDGAKVVVHAELESGAPLRLSKYVAYHWASEAPPGDLVARVGRTLDRAARDGYDMIEFDHRQHVEEFRARSDVQLDGAPELQQAANLAQVRARRDGRTRPFWAL